MLSKSLVIVICILSFLLAIYQNKYYNVSLWKLALIILFSAPSCYAGIRMLTYLEVGHMQYWSFFGCIFFVPIVYFVLAKIIREPYEVLMDFAGPLCALLFVIMKLNCMHAGCCSGICMFITKTGKEILFPSQLMEAIASGIILVVLLCLQKKEINRGKLAPVFLVLYGCMRFVFSFFRGNPRHFFWLEKTIHLSVPTGQVWSVICIVWGLIWLWRIVTKKLGRKIQAKEYVDFIVSMFKSDMQENDDRS